MQAGLPEPSACPILGVGELDRYYYDDQYNNAGVEISDQTQGNLTHFGTRWRLARDESGVVVTLFPDNAYKYLSEKFWTK